jgi:hypothetical protein
MIFMKNRAVKNRNYWLVVAVIVLIIIFLLVMLRRNIDFSPAKYSSSKDTTSQASMQFEKLFKFGDNKLDKTEQKMTEIFKNAVAKKEDGR